MRLVIIFRQYHQIKFTDILDFLHVLYDYFSGSKFVRFLTLTQINLLLFLSFQECSIPVHPCSIYRRMFNAKSAERSVLLWPKKVYMYCS